MKKVKKSRDYHAMLTGYGFGQMSKAKAKSIAQWLRRLAYDIEQDHRIFSHTRFIARYMK